MMRLPMAVDPVNEMRSTRGSLTSISPAIAGSLEVTTLKTPGGKPACAASSPMMVAGLGVLGAGFSTTVQPASSADMTLAKLM